MGGSVVGDGTLKIKILKHRNFWKFGIFWFFFVVEHLWNSDGVRRQRDVNQRNMLECREGSECGV